MNLLDEIQKTIEQCDEQINLDISCERTTGALSKAAVLQAWSIFCIKDLVISNGRKGSYFQ